MADKNKISAHFDLKPFKQLLIGNLRTYITLIRCDENGNLQGKYRFKRKVQELMSFWKLPPLPLYALTQEQQKDLKYFSLGDYELNSARKYFRVWSFLTKDNLFDWPKLLSDNKYGLEDSSELKKILYNCFYLSTNLIGLIKSECLEFVSNQNKITDYREFVELKARHISASALTEMETEISNIPTKIDETYKSLHAFLSEKIQEGAENFYHLDMEHIIPYFHTLMGFQSYSAQAKDKMIANEKVTKQLAEFKDKYPTIEEETKNWPVESNTTYKSEMDTLIDKLNLMKQIESEKFSDFVKVLNQKIVNYCDEHKVLGAREDREYRFES